MDETAFRTYLRRGGRSPGVADKAVRLVKTFQSFLQEQQGKAGLDDATTVDLDAFTTWIEQKLGTSAKMHLWAIRYYYHFLGNDALQHHSGALREQRIKRTRKPFALGKFRGVNPDHIVKLAHIGIKDVDVMLANGRTHAKRVDLAEQTQIPLEAIVELVKLSDLARIQGLKGIRARLYHDAGVDTLDKLAKWNPEELRAMLQAFVERTGFNGIAPLPKEAQHAVAKAKELPRIVEY